MINEREFVDRLFQVARREMPASGAEERALGVLATVSRAGLISGSVSWFGGWGLAAVVGSAVVAVGAGSAIATHALRSPSVTTTNRSARIERDVPPRIAPTSISQPTGLSMKTVNPIPSVASSPPVASPSQCSNVSLPEAAPSTCSTDGAPALLQLTNACGVEAVDLYWVNYKCQEVFYRQVKPGEMYAQATFATHPWRVRDHATHRLLKEIAATALPNLDAGSHHPKKVEIVVRTSAPPPEASAGLCSEAGFPAELVVVNDHKEPLEMFWLDYDCAEIFKGYVNPSERWEQRTQDAHRWRVRDAKSHALLKEFAIEPTPSALRIDVFVP